MADYNLGTARGTIELDYKGDGPQKAQRDLDDLTSKSDRTAQAYDRVGGTMQKAGAAIGAGIGLAIKSAADFEQKMSAIKAVSGASGQEMEQLGQKAMQLGKDTSFSASEAAAAIEELVKAGVSVPDVMNGAADATVALAEAGQINLKDAATVMSDVMNQFKMDAQELPHVADALAGAANASSASVQDLGEAFKYVGPVAKSAGMSFDDTNLALAVLAQNGIRGSEAGTGLRGVLAGLTPTTDKQKQAFKELGLITKDGSNIFYDANGKLKPFTEIIGILRDKTANLSDEEKKTFYEGAFGRNAWPVISALVNTTGQEFSDMSKRIGEVKAADVAAQRMDNFKGSLEKLKGSVETLMITIGTPLLKSFTDLADGINTVVGWFLKLPPIVQEVGAKFAIFTSGLLIAAGTIMKVVAFVARFKEALITLEIIPKIAGFIRLIGPALATIGTVATGPVGIVIAAIAALIAIFVALYTHNEKFRAFVDGIVAKAKELALAAFDKIKEGIQALVDGFNGVTTATGFIGFLQDVGAAARTFWDALKELWAVWQQTIWPMLKDAGSQIWAALKQAWVDMKPALVELWGALKELWKALEPLRQPLLDLIGIIAKVVAGIVLWTAKMNLETIVTLIKLAAAIATTVLPPMIEFATFIITKIIPAIADWIIKIVEIITKMVEFATAVIDGFTKAKDKVVETVGLIIQKIQEIISKITEFVTNTKTQWDQFWDGIRQKAIEIWTAIKDAVTNGFTAIKDAFTTHTGEIKTSWDTFWNGVRDFLAPIWESIKGVVQTGINNTKVILDQVTGAIKAAWDAFWNLFGPPVTAAWELIKSIVQLGIAVVRDVIVTTTTQIRQTWESVWNAIKGFIGPIWESIKAAITTAATAVRDTLAGIWNSVKTTAESIWNSIKASASTIWTAIKSAIGTAIDGVKGVLSGVWNSIKATAESVWNSIKSAATSIWNAIKSAIEGPANATKGSLQSIWNSIKSTVEGIWNSIKSAASSIWNSIKSAIEGPINAAKGAVQSAVNAMKDVVTSAWNAVKSATSDTWGKFSSTIKTEVDKALAVVTKIKDTVVNAVKDAGTWLLEAGKALVQGFIDGITRKLGELKAKVQEMTDLTKKHTEQQLQSHSPSQVFLQYGQDVVQGFINGIDKLFPGLRAKLKEFSDLVQKIVQEKLKIGSPSQIFHQFGIETMQGFINGLMTKIPEIQRIFDQLKEQFPQIQKAAADAASKFGINFTGNIEDAVRQVQGSSDKIKSAIKDVFLTGDLRGQLSDALGVDIMEDSPLVDGILSMRDKILAAGGSLKDAASTAIAKFTPIAEKLAPMGDKIVSALKPLPDKIKPIADAVKGVVQQIASQLPKLSDLLSKFDTQSIAEKLKPLAPTIRGLVQSGDLQGLANLVPQVAPNLPSITVNPAQVNGVFPDKIVLRVGDREFDAYVDGRADQLLSRAASLLSRGRK